MFYLCRILSNNRSHGFTPFDMGYFKRGIKMDACRQKEWRWPELCIFQVLRNCCKLKTFVPDKRLKVGHMLSVTRRPIGISVESAGDRWTLRMDSNKSSSIICFGVVPMRVQSGI